MSEKRLVVKVGTNTLTDDSGRIDRAYIADLIEQVAQLKADGWDVVIVTSGAIAAGVEALGLSERPSEIALLQAAAATGQVALIDAYATKLKERGLTPAQVLLTRHDTGDRHTYLHARATLEKLLDIGAVPIVNENDTVAIEEIAFGDNDTLAALVATVVDASLVVLMTDVEGLFTDNPRLNPDARLVEEISYISQETIEMARGTGTHLGSGGMVTKLRAARVLLASGIRMVLCNGRAPQALVGAVAGTQRGTYFVPDRACGGLNHRKRWIAVGDAAQGKLTIDEGAVKALHRGGNSLLSAGVIGVDGTFDAQSPVAIVNESGMVVARGISAYSSEEIASIIGAHSDEVLKKVPHRGGAPVVHCDDLAVL